MKNFKEVDRAFKLFVFEAMNLTDVNKRNYIKRNDKNEIIPWDDPYPNISATLSEEQQILLKSLKILDDKKEFDEKKNARMSSASTTKSIKFQENEVDSPSPSSILKSRSSTKLSGRLFFYLKNIIT